MSFSYLRRWKFTDSCGQPQASGAIHVGCAHDGHTACTGTTRRTFFKTGVAGSARNIRSGSSLSTPATGGKSNRRAYGYPRPHRAGRFRAISRR